MEADLEVIALPGWEAVPRREPMARPAKARILAAVAIIALLVGDVWAVYRVTAVQAAERLAAQLAEARALESMRSDADQELRMRALFPEDFSDYADAVQLLGFEHADRVAALAKQADAVDAVDAAVRRARRELAAALTAQEKSIRDEAHRRGTVYDKLADEFPEAIAAVEQAGRRWGLAMPAASPPPFTSVDAQLAEWRKLLPVATGLKVVATRADISVVDLDTGAERVVSEDADYGRVFGRWALVQGRLGQTLVDLVDGRAFPLHDSWLIPAPGGETAWRIDPESTEAVEVRLPDTPTGARFRGWLMGDTGTHLVATTGGEESELPSVVLYDRVTHRPLRDLGQGWVMGYGRDALAWAGGDGRLHLLQRGVERVLGGMEVVEYGQAEFTADGRTAAIALAPGLTSAQVWIVREGAAPVPVAGLDAARQYVVHWSPDGNWLLASDGRRHYAVSADGGAVHRIRLRTGTSGVLGFAP